MPSSSLILSVGTILSALSSTVVATKYQQEESFTGKNWLDAFQFKTDEHNNGFVNYVDQDTAMSHGLYATSGDDVLFGVDSTETLNYKSGPGRMSVRLEGTKNYNKGLFILDVKRMPGVCGMWPAFWSLGEEPWPVKGEIDIIEGVNDNTVNKYVLHTDTKCKVDGLGQSNPAVGKDCAYDTAGSAGCDVNEVRTNSFGANFNRGQGGYYVMEWDSDAIKTWFFPRGGSLPHSLTSENPDTSEFGIPAANFKGDCNIDQRFKDQRFIFTNNFCGDWAGNTYANSNCPKQFDDLTHEPLDSMESCKKYVAKNPRAFEGQYWQIGSFRTFSKKSIVSSSSVSLPKSSSMASSSTRVSSTPIHASSTPGSSTPAHASSTPASASSRAMSSSALVSSSASHAASSAASSSAAASSLVHSSVNSHASSEAHSASSASSQIHHSSSASSAEVHESHSTPAASASSDAYSASSVAHVSSGTSSSMSSGAVYPSLSGNAYPAGSTSAASVHYDSYPSAPASYPAPAYSGSASAPVYGDDAAKSTPCTTSSAMGASSTPGYPVYPNSASGYGDYPSSPVSSPAQKAYPHSAANYNDYPSYPVSSPVKNDYPYLPSFTPVSPVYPSVTSKATYDDSYQSTPSKATITTTYTTTYTDVCETGYTTKATTFAVTYCPTTTPAVPTPGKPINPPTYGWDVTTKICNKGCGSGPTTVTVTVPCTQCDYATKPTPTPAVPQKPVACNGHDCTKDASTTTSKVYETKIITLTKSPVPDTPKSATPMAPSSSAPGYGGEKPASKPVVEAPKSVPVGGYPGVHVSAPVSGKPAVPTGKWVGANNNGTMGVAVSTGVYGTPSKTGYSPPMFTGAASSVRVNGFAAVVGGVVAAMIFL